MKTFFCFLVLGIVLFSSSNVFASDDGYAWSADKKYYIRDFYFNPPTTSIEDASVEREKLVVYRADGTVVATAHIWLVEANGTQRAGIRGCEQYGWVGNTHLFCQGTINPRTAIRRTFDALTGTELSEEGPYEFEGRPNN